MNKFSVIFAILIAVANNNIVNIYVHTKYMRF